MEIEKLNAILEAHAKWLASDYREGERANLSGANLSGANLSGANLSRAYLSGANLSRAYLSGANLDPIKKDFFEILDATPNEVSGLLAAIREGRVDGSTYHGECACLVGTIANIRKCDYDELGSVAPDSSRPAERFFLCIKKGDTPATKQASKIVEDWIL